MLKKKKKKYSAAIRAVAADNISCRPSQLLQPIIYGYCGYDCYRAKIKIVYWWQQIHRLL